MFTSSNNKMRLCLIQHFPRLVLNILLRPVNPGVVSLTSGCAVDLFKTNVYAHSPCSPISKRALIVSVTDK